MRAVLSLLVLVAGIVTGVFLLTGDSTTAPPSATGRAERGSTAEPSPGLAGTGLDDRGAGASRERLPGQGPGQAAPPTSDPVPLEPETVLVHGRTLDISGQPLASVPVREKGSEEVLTTSDGSGRFELTLTRPIRNVVLVTSGAGYAAVCEGVVDEKNALLEHLLVAAPAVDLAGRVVDGAHRPLEGAGVNVDLGAPLAKFPLPLDMARTPYPGAVSRADGSFSVAAVPTCEGAVVTASLQGHRSVAELAMPLVSRTDLLIVLHAEDAQPRFGGTVLLPDGDPANGATVRFGGDITKCDEFGAFSMPLPEQPHAQAALAAGLYGYGIAHVPDFGEILRASSPEPPAPVVLQLAEPLVISGQVVDASGAPLEGWRVSIKGGLALTRGRVPPILVEGMGGGRTSDRSDADGEFALENLLPRDYRVHAYDPGSLVAVDVEAVAAGTRDLRIVVPEGSTHPRIAGRVSSRLGQPMVDVEVSINRVTAQQGGATSWVSGHTAATDEQGAFELLDVARGGVHLRLNGPKIIPVSYEFQDNDDLEHLQLIVDRRCHFKVQVSGANLTELKFEVRDAEDNPLSIQTFRANSSYFSSRVSVPEDGSIPVSTVGEAGVTLVLLQNGEPVLRREVAMNPDEVSEFTLEFR